MNSEWGRDGVPHSEAAGGGFPSKSCDNNVSKDELPGNDCSGVGVSSEPAGAGDLVPDLPLLPEGRWGQGGLPGGPGLPHPHHRLQPKCRLVLFILTLTFNIKNSVLFYCIISLFQRTFMSHPHLEDQSSSIDSPKHLVISPGQIFLTNV